MTTVFLTGDRSMNPLLAVSVAGQLLAEIGAANAIATLTGNDPIAIATGDNAGFERAIRDVLEGLGATPTVVPTGTDPDTGKPAWDIRHEVVNALADRVVFIHTDPLSSSLGASLMKVCGDKVELPTLA